LGVRFADTAEPDNAWSRKSGMLALINTPGLARLTIEFDERASRLRLSLANSLHSPPEMVSEHFNIDPAVMARWPGKAPAIMPA
jgi:hypothetical protein